MSEAPTSCRLLRSGENLSAKRRVLFDAIGQAQLAKSIADRGVKTPFDIEHFSLNPAQTGADISPDSKAKAWGIPCVRNGELWMDEIAYLSEEVKLAIEAKELLYVSPVLTLDKNDRPTMLVSVAFTNAPALHGIEPLTFSVYSQSGSERTFPEMDEILKQILALLQKIDAAISAKEAPKESEPSEDSELFSVVSKITGKATRQEQIGGLLALSVAVQKGVQGAKAAAVDALIAKGLITPADKSDFMRLSDGALAAFSATASTFSPRSDVGAPPAPSASKSLNDAEVASFAAAAGVSVEAFKASMKAVG